MPKISEMQKPVLPLSGLEMIPALQGGGIDANVGVPILAYGGLPNGNVLALRAPMTADLSATTDADPGAGNVRWNNADPDLATVLYVNDADTDAGNLTSVWSALTVGGFVYVQASDDSDRRGVWQKWQVASITDATGYAKIGVSLQGSNGAFVDDEPVEFTAQQPSSPPGIDRNVITTVSSSSGTTTCDASLGDYFKTALTENTTLALSNVPAACTLHIQITQHASTGPYTAAFPSGWDWGQGNSAPTMPTGAGKIMDVIVTTNDSGATGVATARNRA